MITRVSPSLSLSRAHARRSRALAASPSRHRFQVVRLKRNANGVLGLHESERMPHHRPDSVCCVAWNEAKVCLLKAAIDPQPALLVTFGGR